MYSAMRANNYHRVVAEYQKLPESLKRMRSIMVMRCAAARKIGHDEFAKAIEDVRRYDPESHFLDVMLVDYYFEQKQYHLMRETVDRLDAVVQDPCMDIVRGTICSEQGNTEEAERLINKAIAADPALAEFYQ